MNVSVSRLKCIMIDDDHDYCKLFEENLPTADGIELEWDVCNAFDIALKKIESNHYCIIVSDIYNGDPSRRDTRGASVLTEIRTKSFTPVILTSTSPKPPNITESSFVRFVKKVGTQNDLKQAIQSIVDTGIPQLKERLRMEIDRDASGFLWQFLDQEWDKIKESDIVQPEKLYGFIRRRTAQSLGRLKQGPGAAEQSTVDATDYYIYPSISGDVLRMGQIIRETTTSKYYIVLTPHCLLENQTSVGVRADYILLAPLRKAKDVCKEQGAHVNEIQQWVAHPCGKGKPSGRYFFLPRFLEMEDMYADILAITSIAGRWPLTDFERLACLDAPYAEALQSQFLKLYSSVGLPVLAHTQYAELAALRDEIFSANDLGVQAVEKKTMINQITISRIPTDVSRKEVEFCIKDAGMALNKPTISWSDLKGRCKKQQ
ncbi:DNA-binding transcriptional response regulator [Fundidesulfovibrio putealis]|uniref:hypothetical protein n=1 Tax=Fundidesulfovibrio putealis TaxID=270496 RepID=UPI0003F9FB16|nr:hypothetical protein [Fundidesulfovibrio putealis]